MPLTQALQSGYEIGRTTGGRLSGVGMAIKSVADRLRGQRETQEGLGVLGETERMKQQIKAEYDPEAKYKEELYKMILGKRDVTPQTDIAEGISGAEGFKPESFELGGITFKKQQTEAERQRDIQQKAEEQAAVASEKERQLNISKVSRLGSISDILEEKFLETSPYTGGIAKTGIMPLLGIVDVLKSSFQATEAQRTDLAYRKFVKGMRAQLARAMGDVGNLSEPEQKAAMELVPTLMDSKETGLKKLDNLRDFIATIRAGGQSGGQRQLNDPLGLR